MTTHYEHITDNKENELNTCSSQKLSAEFRKIKRNSFFMNNNLNDNHSRIKQLVEHDKQLLHIVEILLKKYKERTHEENKYIISFLLNNKIKEQFNSLSEQITFTDDNFYKHLEHYITLHYIKKEDVIYLENNKADTFYLLLFGDVNEYSLEQSTDALTVSEYYEYLDNYYDEHPKETFLIMKIIEANNNIYPVYNINDIQNYKEIIYKCKLRLFQEEGNKTKLNALMQEHHEDESQLSQSNESNENEEKDNFYCTKLRTYLLHSEKKQLITKLAYRKQNSYISLTYFGLNNINDNHYTFTSKCFSKNAIVISINKKNFISTIQTEIANFREKEREYLYSKFFFNSMHKTAFIKRVFDLCKIIELKKHDLLLTQDESISKFYFTRYGTVQLYLDKISINELKQLIFKIKTLLPQTVLTTLNVKENYEINNSYETVKQSMEMKRRFLLLNTEKGLFGECELFYNELLQGKSLFNINIISDKAKFYTYDYDIYESILEEFPKVKVDLHKAVQMKMKYILERLITINNNYHRKINEEFDLKLNEDKGMLTKQYSCNYNLSNDTHKIKLTPCLVNNSERNLKVFTHKKNKMSYISYDNDLYKDLLEKTKRYETMSFHQRNKTGTELSYNFSSFSRYNNTTTKTEESKPVITNKDIERYKSPRLCLPIIEDSKLRFEYVKRAFKNKVAYSLDKFGNTKYSKLKMQNVPLINKLKQKQNNDNNINGENKSKKVLIPKKIDFTYFAPKYKEKHNIKNIINSIPGGYYMAVHQFISDKTKKFYEQ